MLPLSSAVVSCLVFELRRDCACLQVWTPVPALLGLASQPQLKDLSLASTWKQDIKLNTDKLNTSTLCVTILLVQAFQNQVITLYSEGTLRDREEVASLHVHEPRTYFGQILLPFLAQQPLLERFTGLSKGISTQVA